MDVSHHLYGLDDVIEDLCTSCKIFTEAKDDKLSKFSQLSIYPTFLFDGYPGTGKSSVATIIYEQIKKSTNIDLQRLNIDELISYNFGESSTNLREYFAKRKKEIEQNKSHCFIIMDEVDSFTISRYQNDNESIKRILLTFNSIIDELIRTKEIYNYIIIATTNVKESVDTSILRRFYFKKDFNIQLDLESFKKFITWICELTQLKFDGDMVPDLYMIYEKKRYTLGEIKSLLSEIYFKNLKATHSKLNIENKFNIEIFEQNKTFHEIIQKQV